MDTFLRMHISIDSLRSEKPEVDDENDRYRPRPFKLHERNSDVSSQYTALRNTNTEWTNVNGIS